jgi:galactosyl transferase GMA12/MNN10 family
MHVIPSERAPKGDLAVITFNHVPSINHTFKYERLGGIALENRRRYCEDQEYRLISDVPGVPDRPACWAKIPAILQALETHAWVVWADSDTLVMDRSCRLERFCDPAYDLVVQSHEEFYRFIGVPLQQGLDRMPVNTGVFLTRSTAWSKQFLSDAYAQTQYVSGGEIWDGIGEQEAMIHLLRRNPEDRRRIKYVEGLQNHPRLYRAGDAFVHFYGNHARHRIPLAECEEVLGRWERASRTGAPFPADLCRFHWCCIQNKRSDSPVVRGDLEHYLYRPEDVAPA